MRKITKMLIASSLLGLSAAATAGVISINVAGQGGTENDAIDAAFEEGALQCESSFGGIAAGVQVLSVQHYPGFWWAEVNVLCNVP
ncbi:hypothetical protein MNO14_07535 [Luteimonas sp. S4-F44]|uniref:hypothetical protein n=1 Tax=Luteimonas sp. S4-F44 TaxID=2925842 RepID=UPI001F53CAB2|nr:hypothetical protein [Luteimonas sp. S4-F44]UNK43890.1 hypothetical protein MNO14_07535 [Luteimonas sp. S4-F44]